MRKTAFSSYVKKQHYTTCKNNKSKLKLGISRKFKLISKLNDKPKEATINDQKVENGLFE